MPMGLLPSRAVGPEPGMMIATGAPGPAARKGPASGPFGPGAVIGTTAAAAIASNVVNIQSSFPQRQRQPPRVVLAIITMKMVSSGARMPIICNGRCASFVATRIAMATKPRVSAQPSQVIGVAPALDGLGWFE